MGDNVKMNHYAQMMMITPISFDGSKKARNDMNITLSHQPQMNFIWISG